MTPIYPSDPLPIGQPVTWSRNGHWEDGKIAGVSTTVSLSLKGTTYDYTCKSDDGNLTERRVTRDRITLRRNDG